MSDTIWFATRETNNDTDAQNAADSSGFNGFPFAMSVAEVWDGSTTYTDAGTFTEEGVEYTYEYVYRSNDSSEYTHVVGPGTPWVKMSIQDAVKMHWRVKSWTMAGDFSGTVDALAGAEGSAIWAFTLNCNTLNNQGTLLSPPAPDSDRFKLLLPPVRYERNGNWGSWSWPEFYVEKWCWEDGYTDPWGNNYGNSIEGTGTASVTPGDDPSGSHTAYLRADVTPYWGVLSPHNLDYAYNRTQHYYVVDDPGFVYINLAANLFVRPPQVYVDQFASNYGTNHRGAVLDTQNIISTYYRIPPGEADGRSSKSEYVGLFNIKVFGETYQVPYGKYIEVEALNYDDIDEHPLRDSTLSGEIELMAHEYWAYENSQGQPVWDTETGNEVNPPTS